MTDGGVEHRGWAWETLAGAERAQWLEPSGEVASFVARLRAEGARRVYDLGCGLGRHTVYLAREGMEVCASDLSEKALDHTRSWLAAEGLHGDVIHSDLTRAPYPDAHFDAVIAFNVVYHTNGDGIRACLAELRRALRPGGLALVTFNSQASDDFGKGRRVDGYTFVKVGGVEDGIPHYFVDREELERLVAGLDLLQVRHVEEWFPELGEGKRNAHWVVWARKP